MLAKAYINGLIRAFDPEKDDYSDFSSAIFYTFTPMINDDAERFELDLIFDMAEEFPVIFPDIMKQVYHQQPGGRPIWEVFRVPTGIESPFQMGAHLPFTDDIKTSFLAGIIRELIRDTTLLKALEKVEQTFDAVLAFTALLWQLNRNTAFDPNGFTDNELTDYLCFDRRHLPFTGKIEAFLSQADAGRQETVVLKAVTRTFENLEKDNEGWDAAANIVELMSRLNRPEYLPRIIESFLWESAFDDDTFYSARIKAASSFGDTVFPLLDSIMDRIPEIQLIDVLELIRKVSGPRAETFLLNHFNRLITGHREDTLEACRSLVSEKVLERLAHKVGKGQTDIDRLFVLVKSVKGESGPETEKLLDEIRAEEEANQKRMQDCQAGIPQPVLKLELECIRCGDISFYPCGNIILSPDGDAYVADELTCIACDRISEFDPTVSSQIRIRTEALMRFETDHPDETMPGALKIVPTSVMGREMSIKKGIALYKEKIKKQPKNPEHYIGLGNIYKFHHQYGLAKEQYEKAVKNGAFYIEAYLNLAAMAKEKGNPAAALEWLEKGRPYLKRPVICKGMQTTGDQIMDAYQELHVELLLKTGSTIPAIRDDELMPRGQSLSKIGRNEKCPCGSKKKYKKCCMKKR